MSSVILSVSTWCSLNMNSLSGYYHIEMDRKLKCQEEILKCLDEASGKEKLMLKCFYKKDLKMNGREK